MNRNILLIIAGAVIVILAGVCVWLGVGRADITAKNNKLEAANNEFNSKIDDLKSEHQQLQDKYDELKRVNMTLKRNFESAKKEKQLAERGKEQFTSRINELQTELEQYKEYANDLSEKIRELQDNNRRLRDELERRESQLEQTSLIDTVFTSALDGDNLPVDRLNEVDLGAEKFYLHMRWQMPPGNHTCRTKIFDGSGKPVYDREHDFTSKKFLYYTWVYYNINEQADSPGRWKFEIYMDGEKAGERYLTVTEQ